MKRESLSLRVWKELVESKRVGKKELPAGAERD